jgi:hypothetical protein
MVRERQTPLLKGYSLPTGGITKHLSLSTQARMKVRGELMMELRADPLKVYATQEKEVAALLTPKERTAPLRSEIKSTILASLNPKKGSLFPSEEVLTRLVNNINSFSESQLIELLKKRSQVPAEQFKELVLNSKPQQLEFRLKK